MPRRFYSTKMLKFTIPGRPLCKGALAHRAAIKASGESQRLGKSGYVAIARLAALNAVSEQGWEITDKEPLYIAVSINLGAGSIRKKAEEEKLWKGETLAIREPRLNNIFDLLVDAFSGIIWKKRRQIVGCLLIKKYTKGEQNVEVLVGVPRNWGELNHDLRNA